MIATLLALALQLLLAAQKPNVPDSVRQNAIQVATIAIKYAQDNATSTEQLAPTEMPTQATITVVPNTDAPVFGSISTTTSFNIAPTLVTITPMQPLTFTGWTDVKVVLFGGAEASTTITVASGENTSIQFLNAISGNLVTEGVTDQNGEYVFNVGKWFRGSFDVRIKVPALKIDQVVPFIVNN